MKKLITLLLISTLAMGQNITDRFSPLTSITTPMDLSYTSGSITTPIRIRECEIRTLETPKKAAAKVVVVTADGTLKMIEVVRVVTSEIMTEVYNNPNKVTKLAPGVYSSTLMAGGYSYQWEDHAHHYEDKEGNVLTEVYQLIKL